MGAAFSIFSLHACHPLIGKVSSSFELHSIQISMFSLSCLVAVTCQSPISDYHHSLRKLVGHLHPISHHQGQLQHSSNILDSEFFNFYTHTPPFTYTPMTAEYKEFKALYWKEKLDLCHGAEGGGTRTCAEIVKEAGLSH